MMYFGQKELKNHFTSPNMPLRESAGDLICEDLRENIARRLKKI
jgi:hypothetical protein